LLLRGNINVSTPPPVDKCNGAGINCNAAIRFLQLENISVLDVIRAFISVGYPNEFYPLLNGVKIYKLLKVLGFFYIFQNRKNYFYLKDFIYDMDSSEKVQLSYELGMVFAHLISQRKENVVWTLHLSNLKKINGSLDVNMVNPQSKQKPDLIAMDTNKNFYVIEAKGTLEECKSREIAKAFAQVCSIKINGNSPYKRYISYFIGERNTPILVVFIDPEEQGQINVKLDIDRLIEFHYQKLLQILLTKEETKKIKMDKFTFRGITIGVDISKEVFEQGIFTSIFIGLEEEIFNYLKDIKRNSENRRKNCEKIIKRSKHLKKLMENEDFTKDTISLGTDGIIVKGI